MIGKFFSILIYAAIPLVCFNACSSAGNDSSHPDTSYLLFEQEAKACDNGDDNSCSLLANASLCQLKIKDHIPECFQLGSHYGENTINSKPTSKEAYLSAVHFYTIGCELNDGASCNNLGLLYNMGTVKPEYPSGYDAYIKPNYTKALTFYKKACDLDNYIGCNNLGRLYSHGINFRSGYSEELHKAGMTRDTSKAYVAYKKACDFGNIVASCASLSVMSDHGAGIPQDYHTGHYYAVKTCELGDPKACMWASNYYTNGISVPPNKLKAKEFNNKACKIAKNIAKKDIYFDIKWYCN